MGNILGCSQPGNYLNTCVQEGNVEVVRDILAEVPRLARYSTFGSRSTPLHFAAAGGHLEIVNALLECGADINARNNGGQTALMHACRLGHVQVVQSLLLRRAEIGFCDSLSGRTALHYAAANGHVQCLRVVLADLVPASLSVPAAAATKLSAKSLSAARRQLDEIINLRADSAVSALHMAALNGHAECVHLLLDLGSHVDALTGVLLLLLLLKVYPLLLHAAVVLAAAKLGFARASGVSGEARVLTPLWDTGAGGWRREAGSHSTPLHYAACSGSFSCCQALIARGADRSRLNGNGWTAQHVAKLWRKGGLDELLDPTLDMVVPPVPTSPFLVLPLMSAMRLARDVGLAAEKADDDDERDTCALCFEMPCNVATSGCGHELCHECALRLCSSGSSHASSSHLVEDLHGAMPCPFCRQAVTAFVKVRRSEAREVEEEEEVRAREEEEGEAEEWAKREAGYPPLPHKSKLSWLLPVNPAVLV
eukprot:jgi/Mesen1/10720/ME000090S10177